MVFFDSSTDCQFIGRTDSLLNKLLTSVFVVAVVFIIIFAFLRFAFVLPVFSCEAPLVLLLKGGEQQLSLAFSSISPLPPEIHANSHLYVLVAYRMFYYHLLFSYEFQFGGFVLYCSFLKLFLFSLSLSEVVLLSPLLNRFAIFNTFKTETELVFLTAASKKMK